MWLPSVWAEITFEVALITSSAVKITFVVTDILFLLVDISLLVTKINFVLAGIFFKEAVNTSSMDKITCNGDM